MSEPTTRDLPERIVVDANGNYWRWFEDVHGTGPGYSMCPVSDDNQPIEERAVYVPVRTALNEWAVDVLVGRDLTLLKRAHEIMEEWRPQITGAPSILAALEVAVGEALQEARVAGYEEGSDAWRERALRADRELRVARAVLFGYGDHMPKCVKHQSPDRDCDCGYSDLFDAASERKS